MTGDFPNDPDSGPRKGQITQIDVALPIMPRQPAVLHQYHLSGIRFDADPVIDGRSNSLLTVEMTFVGLNPLGLLQRSS